MRPAAPGTAVYSRLSNTNIVTGGNDAQADEIVGFFLPTSYSPPIVLGDQSLPADLYSNAVATADAKRFLRSVARGIAATKAVARIVSRATIAGAQHD